MKTTLKQWNNLFGNKAFIQSYWKIAIPAFLWAIFVSLAPIFVTLIIVGLLPNNLFGNNNINLNNIFNYNVFGYSYIDVLSVVFIMAGFSIVGNFIGQKNFKNLNEIMKQILLLSLLVSIILVIFLTIYASNFEQNLLGFNQTNLTYGAIFLSWSSISIIFYMLNWYFISSFSCLNLIWVQFISSLISLILYIFVITLYSHSVLYSTHILNKVNIVRNYAILFDFWYFIQALIVFGYCYLPKTIKLKKIENKLKLVVETNVAFDYFYFLRTINWKWDRSLLIFYFKYAYWIMLDVSIWAIADIFSQIGGVIDPHAGLSLDNIHEHIYHIVILVCAQYSTYLYLFFNGFGLITNHFLALPLAKNNTKIAKQNTKQMFWWGFAIALFLLLMVLIISYELNIYLIGGNNTPNVIYVIKTNNSNIVTNYTYKTLWNMAMVMDVIYGMYMFINIMFNNIYYFELSGNSRWIWFTDAFVSVVYAILTWSLILCHNNLGNMFAWFILNKSYVLWKLTFGLIVIYKDKALNSINHPHWLFKTKK